MDYHQVLTCQTPGCRLVQITLDNLTLREEVLLASLTVNEEGEVRVRRSLGHKLANRHGQVLSITTEFFLGAVLATRFVAQKQDEMAYA